MRTFVYGSRLALVVFVGMKASTDVSSAATPTRGETLFGMNVPSLGGLAEAESATGIRPAIVGTFADRAHTPDFPRALADQINGRGAVP